MVSKFRPAKNVDQMVARMVTKPIDRIAQDVQARAKENAPGVKQWVSQRDGRVRPAHVRADGQQRPANLRYELESTAWDKGLGRDEHNPDAARANRVWTSTYFHFDEGRHQGGANAENFQEALKIAYVQAVNCRCYTVLDPEGLSRKIKRDDAEAKGTRVRARVHITAPFAIEAERGDTYYLGTNIGDKSAPATNFMRNAARDTAMKGRLGRG